MQEQAYKLIAEWDMGCFVHMLRVFYLSHAPAHRCVYLEIWSSYLTVFMCRHE